MAVLNTISVPGRPMNPTDFYVSSRLIWFVTARIHVKDESERRERSNKASCGKAYPPHNLDGLLPKVLVRMISNILAMLIKKLSDLDVS